MQPVETPTGSPPSALPAGEISRTIIHDGRERSYIIYVPVSLNWSQPPALVFVFHGGTGNAQNAIHMTGFHQIADQNGFLVVYPNGTGRLSDDKLLTWNAGNCCGYAYEEKVDDVGFVRAIVTDLETVIKIDPKRIYATGMSNGALLSHRLGCEASDLFAGIAPVAGTLNTFPCKPSYPISVIMFHGTEDQHILYNGGAGPQSRLSVDFTSVQDSVEFWTAFNNCAEPQSTTFDEIQHQIWTDCANFTAVELYTIIGGGHAWPGGRSSGRPDADQPTLTISASELIWEFFITHPKPEGFE
jgi:polyhydroxybutyrate depolymerase